MPNVYQSPAFTSADNGPESNAINYEAIREREHYGPVDLRRGVAVQPESDPVLRREMTDTMHTLSPEILALYAANVKEAGTAVTSARLAALAAGQLESDLPPSLRSAA